MARRQKNIVRSTRFAPTFESLEQRQLLAANVLANGFLDNINLNNPGDTHQLQLEVNSQESLTFAFDMRGQEGLDPGAISIQSVSGHTIAPISATNGLTSSTFLAELGPGSYEITVLADGGTTGSYDFSVSLVGDLNGDNQVSPFEELWTQAAMAQASGNMNSYTASYYSSCGLPVNQNLYDLDIDANRDGTINGYDYTSVRSNVGNGSFSIELTNDSAAPVIFADLFSDTGHSDTDGISKDITITGNVIDAADSAIVSFEASIDNGSSVSLLGDVDANGDFTLDQARLEEIAGVSLDDGQEHTLYLTAADEYGNVSEQAYKVNFTLDTIAPVAPGTPDMNAASDLGYSDTDNLTVDNTPTFTITAEAGAKVELYSDVAGPIGEGIADANGEVTITAPTLADGAHAITATATDDAGNVSAVSTGLTITIDTSLPTAPAHDLAAASDTGTQDDQFTLETSVTIEGITDPNTKVMIVGTSMETDSDASGNFSFSGVALEFGENVITVRATSESGAINESTTTYIQNNAPTATAIAAVNINENDGEAEVATLTDIFSDANLSDGDSLTYEITSSLPSWLSALTIENGKVYATTEGELDGTSTIEIKATDSYGEFVTGTFDLTVAPENDLPGYSSTPFTVDGTKDVPIIIDDVSMHFADEETPSNELTITYVSAEHGTAVIENGKLTFTPEAGYSGNEALVKLNVTDKAYGSIPANAPQELTLYFNIANKNYEVVANNVTADAIDEDNVSNTLIDSSVAQDHANETALEDLTFELVGASNGVLTITGGSVEIVEESGSRYFRFTPDQDWNGTTSFDYTVTDTPQSPDGTTSDTATVTITVNPVNDAPVAADAARTIAEDGGTVEIPVADLVSDVDTDMANLNISIDSDTNGVAEIVDINGVDTFRFTPDPNYNGAASFTYTVEDTVDNSTDSGTVNITVTPVNDAPEANGDSVTTTEDQYVDVELRDLVSDVETADADLIFHITDETNGSVELIDGHIARFTPDQDFNNDLGAASFAYTVQDAGDNGAAAILAAPETVNVSVTPVNDAPVADDATRSIAEDGGTVDIPVADLVSDVDTDFANLNITIDSDTNGTAEIVDVAGVPTFRFTPTVNFNGAASFTYTVEDTVDSSTDSGTVDITVTAVNDAPQASGDSLTTNEDTYVEIDLRTLVTDVETVDDALVFSLGGEANGSVELIDGHIARFTPSTDFNDGRDGSASFTYTVQDTGDNGAAAITAGPITISVSVTAVNDAPVAVNDPQQQVPLYQDTTLDVLANDYDPDNGSGETDTMAIVSAATTESGKGSVSIVDNKLVYTPESGATEEYQVTISYTIEDGSGAQDTATIVLDVVPNTAPVAVDDTATIDENGSVNGNMLNGDSDADGDALTIADIDTTGTVGSVTYNPDNGSFTYDLTGVNDFNSLGVGETATDSFTYVVSDGKGGTDTGTVTITITGSNDGPVAVGDSVTVNENGSINGNVLTNDSDADTSDTLTVVDYDATSAKGISITVNADGSFTYDLTGSTVFDYLGTSESTTDTFSYEVSDGKGGTSTATVTVTIEGTNDVPVGGDDSAATDNETAITIEVLVNDSDAETTLTTSDITNLQVTTDLGATVSINPNGLYYDPTASTATALKALVSGQQLTDTFTYTVTDGSATSSVVTVTVVVTGVENNAPQVDNAIADMTLADGDDQPDLIDLTTVFSDMDGHNLSFQVSSTNPEIVTVQIVNDTYLKVEYVDYSLDQDRTPAVITVTATETDSNESLTASDEFTVTVTPVQPMEFYLVVRDTATDTSTAIRTEDLPGSLESLDMGDSYVVEIWVTHTYYTADSTTGTGVPIVVSSAQGDLMFDNSLSSASSVGHEGAFYYMQAGGTIDNANSVVNDIDGANYTYDDVGVNPYYSRLGYVVFNATAEGTQEFDFNVDFAAMLSAGEDMDSQQIVVYGTSVDIVNDADSYAFDIDSRTWVTVAGEIGGETLTAQSGHSDADRTASAISGTLNVAFDNYDTPNSLEVVSGTLDPGLYDGSDLSPGAGGESGSAEANFGLGSSSYEVAIRNLNFTFGSDPISLVGNVHFNASEVDIALSGGIFDYRSTTGSSHGSINLAEISSDKITITPETGGGGIYDTGSERKFDCTCVVTVDLSDTFSEGSYIQFSLNINSYYDASAAIMGTVSAEDTPTDVAMTVVKNATATNENSEVEALPNSEAWLDEWDAYWVEVWVKTEEGTGVNSANVDVTYNGDYFTATEIEYSSAVIGDFTGDILTDGLVSGLGGTFDSSGVGVDGYVLLGRVKFESLADDGVELDVESFGIKPFDLGLNLKVNDVKVDGVDQATVGVDRAPTTELWAMPYDVNDDDVIDLYDLSKLLTHYRADVTESSNAMTQVLDFNNDATVDLRDLSYILSNFRATKESGVDICFPETFTQRWVGSGLDITGESTAGELLDSATSIWQNMLGTDTAIDIQLVVSDFGSSTQLASAEILAVDENGMPIAGRVTIDDDAAGLGWYCQVDGAPDAEMYDLYTVMLHEIGHTLGFVGSYDGFAANLEVVEGEVTFVGEDVSVSMDNAGNHVTDADLSDDLMSSTLEPGVRKMPSILDAQMILAAYEDAEGGASGFAAISAALTAADATEAVTVTTTDFNQVEATLVGDMTWDRLVETRSEETEESTETADASTVDVLFAYESSETPVVAIRSDSETELDEELGFDLAEMIVEEATDEAVDSIFEGWDELL